MTTLKKTKNNQWLNDITEKDANIFDLYIKTQYGERILDNKGLLITSDIEDLADMIYLLYGTAWDRLYTSYTSEYNPIWNVDGTETVTETRDLTQKHSGTDKYAHTGTDTLSHTGTDTYAHTGNDTVTHGGTDTYARTGSETTRGTGTETNTKTGTDTTNSSGTDTNAHSGSDSTSHEVTRDHQDTVHKINGFNSSTGQNADEDIVDHTSSGEDTTNYNSKETETRDLKDQTTYNTTDKNTKDLTDETTYNITDKDTKDLTDETQYNNTNENTKNLTDETLYASHNDNTKDLTDTDEGKIITEHKRGGNIGVTMTQQMLEADLAYWRKLEARFYDNVCKDIIDFITYDVYTNTDETNVGTDGSIVAIEKYVKDIIPAQIDGIKIATVVIEDNTNGKTD